MSAQDADALALWDARARAVISRLDAAIAGDSAPAPPGEIVHPAAVNMGPQPDRIDPWDAYVCRFEEDTAEQLPE